MQDEPTTTTHVQLAIELARIAGRPSADGVSDADRASIRRAADCLASGYFPPPRMVEISCKADFSDLKGAVGARLSDVVLRDEADSIMPAHTNVVRAGFDPPFDMPTTPAEAIATLEAWADPLCVTFDHRKASRAAELLAPLLASMPQVVAAVLAELARARRKFPTWPTDPLHAVAVVGEEAGELTKAVLQAVYEPHKSTLGDVREEATQLGAMVLRFLASMDRYAFTASEQHRQEAAHG